MKTWQDCVAFHGHECGGLTIGYKASLYAIDLLKLEFSNDEQVVCIAENDACGIDAIQVMLGCSIGKGNLLLHIRGKSAYSFYNRKTGKSVRLVLKAQTGLTKEASFAYYQACPPEEMFDVKETTIPLPEKAKLFDSYPCDCCGETTGANWIRTLGDKKLCLDCYEAACSLDICRIRPMEETDREAVAAMMRTFYASDAVLTNGSEEIFQNDITYCVGDSPYLEGYIFEQNEDILGYAMAAKSFSTEYGKPCIWIEDIYLKEEYRGLGIGSRFFGFIEEKYPGCLLRLEAEEENTRAIVVYKKCGFEVLPYLEMKKE